MIQYNLICKLFNSSSGPLYLIKEQSDQKKEIYHYAYDFSDQFNEIYLQSEAKSLKDCKHLRKHLTQITIQNKRYTVFQYQDGELLSQKIKIDKAKGSSDFDRIKNYLAQMLETLFQLHSANILGRVFTTNNIMDCNGQLLFLDFGYGPKLTIKNLDLCAPPEMIEFFLQQNSKQIYGMKIDSWLLGAVLYHLVKFSPINVIEIDKDRVKIMESQDIGEYLPYLKRKMKISDYIETSTSRYPKIFCKFIEALLTYNVDKRLSFSQIYHHDFIKSLNLPNYYRYLAFYEQFNQQNIIQSIQVVEYNESQIFRTPDLENELISKIEIPLLEITVDYFRSAYQFPATSSPRREIVIVGSYSFDIENLFPFKRQDNFQDSRYYQMHQFIRMEQFRFTYLEITADMFIVELSKQNFKLEKVCSYFFRKMAYLILVELLKKLNEDVCPWKCEAADRWQDFKKDELKEFLVKCLKEKKTNTEPVLKKLFNEECLIFLKDERIENCIRDSLEEDQKCFERQKFDSHSIYNQSSQEFLKNGYRQSIKVMYKFVEREQSMTSQPEIKYNSLLLRALLCFLINRIFDLNQLSGFFKNFLQSRTTQNVFTPNELYEYICKDDEEKQEKDLKDILKECFEQNL